MPTVRLTLDRAAERSLDRLPAKIGRQIDATILRIRMTFERGEQPHDMRPLYSRNYPNSFRVDSGEYRVLFSLNQQDDNLVVYIFKVGHRKDVYRGA